MFLLFSISRYGFFQAISDDLQLTSHRLHLLSSDPVTAAIPFESSSVKIDAFSTVVVFASVFPTTTALEKSISRFYICNRFPDALHSKLSTELMHICSEYEAIRSLGLTILKGI
ncbi:unnamed protein product [Lactuca saligna]|uniref:Uncharacterized protein n=1 Tax=Lactuca saligna TaxID=75948 RepID=A0AA35V7Z4_LACSI|nr:unnamed protein product [Lactuca saligna]